MSGTVPQRPLIELGVADPSPGGGVVYNYGRGDILSRLC